jgi:hypothetical protein
VRGGSSDPELLESGVLDRFADKHGPNVVIEADSTGSAGL